MLYDYIVIFFVIKINCIILIYISIQSSIIKYYYKIYYGA